MKRCLIFVFLLFSPAISNSTTIFPVDYRTYEIPAECGISMTCFFEGIELGYVQNSADTKIPYVTYGARMSNHFNGSGDGLRMIGQVIYNEMNGTNVCVDGAGVISLLDINATSSFSQNYSHFVAQSDAITENTVPDIRGLDLEFQGCLGVLNHSVWSPSACIHMAHAGAARFGATGDPSSGIEMDIQGDEEVTGVLHVGPSQSPTPSPTATSATPTATSLTPTPTATRTPGLQSEIDGIIGQTLIDAKNHIEQKVTLTSSNLSSCGITPSITGSDRNGVITVGATGTSCTLTFANAYSNAPHCSCNDRTSAIACRVTASSTTAITIGGGLLVGSDAVDYLCEGHYQ